MLVGGDLGFLSSLVVAAFVAVFGPVLGLVVRRKWRRSVARREEIKRLLVLASEEAARVELQAAEEYGYDYGYRYDSVREDEVFVETPATSAPSPPAPSSATTNSIPYSGSRQLPYQCAVCASPTSTRCSQCKAVRYWSFYENVELNKLTLNIKGLLNGFKTFYSFDQLCYLKRVFL